MDRHIMEALGKAKVVVENGKVVEVTEPKIKYCPLFAKHRGIKEISKETIKENIEFRIRDFGLFTKNRVVEEGRYIVPFGASEILMSALKRNVLDAVVIVADCAGTVITTDPNLVQGLCGRISGIIETSPILEVIEKIEKAGGVVLNKNTAEINQFEGVKKAIELGYKRIAVTVTNLEDAKRCKSLENDDIKILTFGVHTTGIEWSDDITKYFDLITACASKVLREKLKGKIKAQIGKTIPIFALSDFGKEILLERAKDLDNILITIEDLPKLSDNQPKPLI
ncbi:methanogenesis marker 8 protein [Methanocaldococcus fervens]|uniref:Methanogenesis marker protein 8 n=1 Tax=Methanocaldococcus fervens (strain DSM 4213 / JCM 15782 / AG86) TaxID=573064 RepID=C7P791_METFA|nr:methanogenesis marker 8 protein [Methanocaldococcus fervens]ACV24423.1 methanogenesis marker protein 8 [Methanocaldococcus fervens AG86]